MFRSDDHNQTAPFHPRSILNGAGLGQLFDDGIHHRATHLLVGYFPSAIGEGDLGLVALFHKGLHLANLDFKVMFLRPWAQFDFLDLGGLLMTSALMRSE